jgi:hypothetical protein
MRPKPDRSQTPPSIETSTGVWDREDNRIDAPKQLDSAQEVLNRRFRGRPQAGNPETLSWLPGDMSFGEATYSTISKILLLDSN